MKKGGANPLTLARAVMSSYTGGVLKDMHSYNNDKNTAVTNSKGISQKSRKRVSTEQKLNAQISKLSFSIEKSSEQEALKRITTQQTCAC